MGNGRDGSLSPSTDELDQTALSMFGWVLNWKPAFSPRRTGTVAFAIVASVTRSWRSPFSSIPSRPPSRFIVTTSFSSKVSVMRPSPAE